MALLLARKAALSWYDPTTPGPSRAILKGKLATLMTVFDEELVIEGDTITCAAVYCDAPGATTCGVANTYILPSLHRSPQPHGLQRPPQVEPDPRGFPFKTVGRDQDPDQLVFRLHAQAQAKDSTCEIAQSWSLTTILCSAS